MQILKEARLCLKIHRRIRISFRRKGKQFSARWLQACLFLMMSCDSQVGAGCSGWHSPSPLSSPLRWTTPSTDLTSLRKCSHSDTRERKMAFTICTSSGLWPQTLVRRSVSLAYTFQSGCVCTMPSSTLWWDNCVTRAWPPRQPWCFKVTHAASYQHSPFLGSSPWLSKNPTWLLKTIKSRESRHLIFLQVCQQEGKCILFFNPVYIISLLIPH